MAVLHTSLVKSVNPGGRLFCGIDKDNERKNGEFGFLGAYANHTRDDQYELPVGQTQVKIFAAPAGTQVTNGQMPVVIMQPEVMYDNSRMSLTKLSLMKMKAKTPFACVKLENRDKIKVSVESFREQDKQGLALNQTFVLTNGQTYLTKHHDNNAPGQAGQVYFKVVDIEDSRVRSSRNEGKFMKDNYKLYTLEVRIA